MFFLILYHTNVDQKKVHFAFILLYFVDVFYTLYVPCSIVLNRIKSVMSHHGDPRLKNKIKSIQSVNIAAREAMNSTELLNWGSTQGYILTGGNTLNKHYKNYKESELPHYHLKRGDCWEQYAKWEPCNLLVGAWSRPLFMGGFKESTTNDTDSYNIQTSTLFVDIRVPRARRAVSKKGLLSLLNLIFQKCEQKSLKFHIFFINCPQFFLGFLSPKSFIRILILIFRFNAIKARGCKSLQHCSLDELRVLARQHTFAGFSKIEKGSDVCYRHHCSNQD